MRLHRLRRRRAILAGMAAAVFCVAADPSAALDAGAGVSAAADIESRALIDKVVGSSIAATESPLLGVLMTKGRFSDMFTAPEGITMVLEDRVRLLRGLRDGSTGLWEDRAVDRTL